MRGGAAKLSRPLSWRSFVDVRRVRAGPCGRLRFASPFSASLRTYPSIVTRNAASLSSAHGILGLNPDPFTLRELIHMVEGKGKFDWAQTSSLMALAVNLMRDPRKGKAVNPNDFNPFAEKPQKIVLKGAEMLDALKAAFIKPHRK